MSFRATDDAYPERDYWTSTFSRSNSSTEASQSSTPDSNIVIFTMRRESIASSISVGSAEDKTAPPSPTKLSRTDSTQSNSWSMFGFPSSRTAPTPPEINVIEASKSLFALCRTTESEVGFWICFVTDRVRDTKEHKSMLRLARMELVEWDFPENESPGFVYAYTTTSLREAFWEHEDHIIPVKMEELSFSASAQMNEPLLPRFKLLQNLEDLLAAATPTAVPEDPIDSRIRITDESKLELMQAPNPDFPSSQLIMVELTSQSEILAKCSQMISNLRRQVSMIDMERSSFPNGVCPWQLVRQSNGVDVFYKQTPANVFRCFMARAMIAASPSEIKHILRHPKNREEFDPMCRSATLIRAIDENTTILHYVDRKFFVSRDFCVLRHDSTTPEGSVFLASSSVRCSQCPENGVPRAVVLDSGYSMISKGKGSCLMTYVVQVNLQGWLPSVLVDYTIDLQVQGVIQRIQNYFSTKSSYERDMKVAAAAAAMN